MNQQPGPTIITRNLSVSFNDQQVLSNINLDLYSDRVSVAVGPSGSGKTTFLRCLNRLNEFFPGCAVSGDIFLELDEGRIDCNNGKYPLTRLRQRVGMVFQHPNLLPFSIEKNLAMPLKLTLGLDRKDIDERVQWSLQEVGLWEEVKDRLKKGALELSGGQQQRLCLARVISLKPEVILLDEPSASLDYKSSAKIEEMILRLKGKYTILAVTHSLSQMQRIADTVFVFKNGVVTNLIEDYRTADADECMKLIQNAF